MACGGRIGLLSKLLDRAVKNAIWDDRTAIRVEDLHEAFSTAIWFADSAPMEGGPFLGTLDPGRTTDLCTRFTRLAAEVPHEEADLKTHLGTLDAKPKKAAKVRREVTKALA